MIDELTIVSIHKYKIVFENHAKLCTIFDNRTTDI